MVYRDIMNEIKRYRRQYDTAYYEYYDGREPSKNKTKKYKFEQTKVNAVFCALFDIENLYENGLTLSDKFNLENENLQKQIKLKNESLVNLMMEKKGEKEYDKIINDIIILEEFLIVYNRIFKMAFELNDEDFSKLVTYIKKMRLNSLKKYNKFSKKEDNHIINKILKDINTNYKIYSENINKTTQYVTKEEVFYKVLINAVKNALEEDKISKEEVLSSFSSLEIIKNNDTRIYYDENVKKALDDSFDMYSDNFNKVCILSGSSKEKLRQKLKDKM